MKPNKQYIFQVVFEDGEFENTFVEPKQGLELLKKIQMTKSKIISARLIKICDQEEKRFKKLEAQENCKFDSEM